MFKMKVTYSWHVLFALRALEIVSFSLFTLWKSLKIGIICSLKVFYKNLTCKTK